MPVANVLVTSRIQETYVDIVVQHVNVILLNVLILLSTTSEEVQLFSIMDKKKSPVWNLVF